MVRALAPSGAQPRRRPGRSQRRATRRHPSRDPRADREQALARAEPAGRAGGSVVPSGAGAGRRRRPGPIRRRPGSLSSMNRVAPRGEADELARFRRWLTATMLSTFALIVIGGVVRVSDSGLGCGAAGSGTEGWPLCGGRALPFLQENAVIEFSHRVAATIVTVLIAALAIQALRHLRNHRWLVRGSVASAILVLAQAGLGGLTVEHGLHSALVAAHLGLAML